MRCVICGGLANERDDLTAEGLRCAACTMRGEIEGHERAIVERQEQRKQRGAYRRAAAAGWAHSLVMVLVAAVFCYSGGGAHAGWMLPLLAIIVGLRFALWRRLRWAFYVTLAFDVALIAVMLGLGLADGDSEELTGAAIVSAFPALFGALLFSQRRWYMPESKKIAVTVAAPPQAWTDPGQRP